jgi:hypothetical protein
MILIIMPRFIFVVVLLSYVGICQAQHFEGKITYKNHYKSNIPNIPDEQFGLLMGTHQEYFIKGGDYKTSTDGKFFQWQIYRNSENKIYSKLSNADAIYYNDAAINPDEVIKSELKKDVATVAGYQCDQLILTCKSGTQEYFFSSKLSLDPTLFKNFKFNNWYEFVSRAKSIPLKMIIQTAQFTVHSEAVDVKAMALDKSLFTLPEHAKIEKSPY